MRKVDELEVLIIFLFYSLDLTENTSRKRIRENHTMRPVSRKSRRRTVSNLLAGLRRSFLTGSVRVLEILESPGILFWHFPGLESPGKLTQVLGSPGKP